jgi:hypothetical protein
MPKAMTHDELLRRYAAGERDFRRANLYMADLRGAYLSGTNLYMANLRGANLSGAHLYMADLSEADLSRADLSGADLRGADLYMADLYMADLRKAHLSRANLIIGPQRSDGYVFHLIRDRAGVCMVRAGCRYFTVKEARAHWRKTRKGTQLGAESLAAVNYLVAAAKAAGWKV